MRRDFYEGLRTRRRTKGFFVFLYILFSIYFLNYPFGFFQIPGFVSALDKWIIFIGGILLVIGGFSFFRKGKFYSG